MKTETLIFAYALIINLAGFLSMGIDKKKAKNREWRIPESTLFVIAAIGGSIGSITGMYVFRHKTKHKSFVIGMPAILLVQIILLMLLFFSPGIEIR